MTGRPLRDEQRAVTPGAFKPSDLRVLVSDRQAPGSMTLASVWRDGDKVKCSAVTLENIGTDPDASPRP